MGKKRKIDAARQQDGFFCPACNQMALKWPVYSRHLQRCCPDLLGGKEQLRNECLEQADVEAETIKEALKQALSEEELLRKQCVSTHLWLHAEPSQTREIPCFAQWETCSLWLLQWQTTHLIQIPQL